MAPLADVVSSTTTTDASRPRQWNTKNLGMRLGADMFSASCAAGLISPLIAFIDKSIMQTASGATPSILASLRASSASLLRRPLPTLLSRPVALVFLLYGGTYLAANAVDTAASTLSALPAGATTAGAPKFVASSAANLSLCVYKDQAFAKLFRAAAAGASLSGPPRPVPAPCYALFALRDCVTVFASFNLPVRLAPLIDGAVAGRVDGLAAAQFLAPAAVQLFSTPLHLLGLDLYNRPAGEGRDRVGGWRDRWRVIRQGWMPACAARIARIVPAFGVGGVVNYRVRQSLMGKLE